MPDSLYDLLHILLILSLKVARGNGVYWNALTIVVIGIYKSRPQHPKLFTLSLVLILSD